MNKFKNNIAVAAISGVAVFGATAAQADVLATSVLQLENLTFYKGGTTTALNAGDFSTLFYTSSADVSAVLNGVSSLGDGDTDTAAAIDLDPVCVGDCPAITNNGFPIITSAGGAPSSHFSAADQIQEGSPIDGLGVALGADITSASYVSLLGQSSGSSNANNELGSEFVFSGYSGAIDVAFNLTAYIEAFATADSIFPSKAAAAYSVVFSITNSTGAEVFEFEDAASRTNTSPLSYGDARVYGFSGLMGFSTGDIFVADESYTLSARANTNADATMVPEPGMVALLGAGLLGLGFSRKRREA